MTDRARLILVILLAIWALAFGYSFVAYIVTEPTDFGFTKGLNRVEAFLGWQAIAGLLSLPVLAISRGWPKGSGVRRLGVLPFACAVLLVLALTALIGLAVFVG